MQEDEQENVSLPTQERKIPASTRAKRKIKLQEGTSSPTAKQVAEPNPTIAKGNKIKLGLAVDIPTKETPKRTGKKNSMETEETHVRQSPRVRGRMHKKSSEISSIVPSQPIKEPSIQNIPDDSPIQLYFGNTDTIKK